MRICPWVRSGLSTRRTFVPWSAGGSDEANAGAAFFGQLPNRLPTSAITVSAETSAEGAAEGRESVLGDVVAALHGNLLDGVGHVGHRDVEEALGQRLGAARLPGGLRNLLRQLEINNVDEASDGDTAYSLLQKNPPDLIISDWNMVPVSGLDLLRKVRADARLKHIPFIMVTAESKTENVVAAKQAGVSNYIVKPFNADTLRAKIVSVFPAMA